MTREQLLKEESELNGSRVGEGEDSQEGSEADGFRVGEQQQDGASSNDGKAESDAPVQGQKTILKGTLPDKVGDLPLALHEKRDEDYKKGRAVTLQTVFFTPTSSKKKA